MEEVKDGYMFYITSYAFLVRPLGLAREERVF
jgi:hypothetical protein